MRRNRRFVPPRGIRNPSCPAVQGSFVVPPMGDPHNRGYSIQSSGGLNSESRVWATAAKAAQDILAGQGWKLGKILGQGSYARVYEDVEDDDVVIKLTGDYTEAAAWVKAAKSGQKFPALADVQCVAVLPAFEQKMAKFRIFVIVQERLDPLEGDDRMFFNHFAGFIPFASGATNDVRYDANLFLKHFDDSLVDDEKAWFQRTSVAGQQDYVARVLLSVLEGYNTEIVSAAQLKRLFETLRKLRSVGVDITDVHGGNLMVDLDGNIKIADLGLAWVDENVKVDQVRA